MLRRLLAGLLVVLLGLTTGSLSADARPRPAETSCRGVWVVVDFAGLGGGSSTRCATSFDTGSDALRSAGHTLGLQSSMICTIDGKPEQCRIAATAYWSYWQAVRNPDGSFGEWTYSQLGADVSSPKAGNAEGWAFGAGDPPSVQPGAAAPTGSAGPGSPTVASPAPASDEAASQSAAPPESGSPTGLISTVTILVVGGALVGGGLWLRNRRR